MQHIEVTIQQVSDIIKENGFTRIPMSMYVINRIR